MARFQDLDFTPYARHIYDRFLIQRPMVPVEGLFRSASRFVIVTPAADQSLEGQTLVEWFDSELTTLGYPVELVAIVPEGAEPVPERTASEVVLGAGRTQLKSTLERALALNLPADIPFVSAHERDRTTVVHVARPLSHDESAAVVTTFAQLGLVTSAVTEVVGAEQHDAARLERAQKQRGEHLALATARSLPPEVPAVVKNVVGSDDEFWRRTACGGAHLHPDAASALPMAWVDPVHCCLVPTTFPPANIRSYLSLYDVVYLVAPLGNKLDERLSDLRMSRKELSDLAHRGSVRILIPQSIDRYDLGWLADLLHAAPDSVIPSRRLAALAAQDQQRRNPLFHLPATAFERRAVLRALHRLADARADLVDICRSLADGLAESWTAAEYNLPERGAMASISGGLATFGRELGKRLFGRDLFVEFGSSALNVEWAGALGAHLVPEGSGGYSSADADNFLIALSSGQSKAAPPSVSVSEIELAEELLAFDNDTNLLDFVTDLGSGDLARFRGVVSRTARAAQSPEELKDRIRLYNDAVRRYEPRGDRIKKYGLSGVLVAASQLAPWEAVKQVVPFLAPFLPYLQERLLEEGVEHSPTMGRLVDWSNAILAGSAPDAVLVARMRKRVAGMKERR